MSSSGWTRTVRGLIISSNVRLGAGVRLGTFGHPLGVWGRRERQDPLGIGFDQEAKDFVHESEDLFDSESTAFEFLHHGTSEDPDGIIRHRFFAF